MVTKNQKSKVWSKAKKIKGKNPKLYRKDSYGKTIYKSSYGKSSSMGWEVDHIKPKSKGGSSKTRNLQALNTPTNRGKGADGRKKSRHSKSNK
ncbi:HNH endonuclease [Candidatus Mycalebacterium sp.]